MGMRSPTHRALVHFARPVALAAAIGGLCVPAAGWAQVKIKVLPDGSRMIYNDVPAGRRSTPRSGRSLLPSPRIALLIDRHAQRAGLDPDLVLAVVEVESAFDVRARSSKGAMGLMQLMPDTARELGVRNTFDPDQNIQGGTTYLRRLLDRYQGDVRLALAAYNAGPTAVDRYRGVPPFSETRNYITKVLRLLSGRDARRSPRVRDAAARQATTVSRERGARVYVVRDANDQMVFTTRPPRPN